MASLGKDLAAIRNKKDLSIDEVQQITRVPKHILHTIEDGSIFDQIRKNTTYIRSYVRSYAKAVGVSEKDIIRALDEVENNSYSGALNPSDDEPEENSAKQDTEPVQADNKEPQKTTKSEATEKKKAKPHKKSSSSPDPVSAVDWVDVGRRVKPLQPKSKVTTGLLIILLLAAILAAIFVVYHYYYNESDAARAPQEQSAAIQPEAPSDSLRQSLIPENTQPAIADSTPSSQDALGDTLTIAIYAANGRLEPVRVYTDILGQQNPYWVPQGDTIRFNFVNTVRIRAENQYDRLQLLFNEKIIRNYYQQYYNTESGMVELDRSIFNENA